ncbi:MAG: hypothetical protein LBD64_01350, partial [Odoribacteraceae bacterium]|nr:hypothetical protein [Odoribacteraceae bacterium]
FELKYFLFELKYFLFELKYFLFELKYFLFELKYFLFELKYFVGGGDIAGGGREKTRLAREGKKSRRRNDCLDAGEYVLQVR